MDATPDIYTPLPRSFYARETLTVARELLGMFLMRKIDDVALASRIVETEAYAGEDDLACHASRGRTARTEVMFGPSGHAYVYLIYGMYHCFNIVTEAKDFPAAVLIRAVEPVLGVENMQKRRDGKSLTEIASGPGKLCVAIEIDRSLNGVDVCVAEQLWVSVGERIGDEQVEQSPRIGVNYAGACAVWPWRFTIKGSEFLSR